MLHPTLRRGALALGAALAVVAASSAFPQPIARVLAFAAADLVRHPAQNWVTNGGNIYNATRRSVRSIATT
jgi:hypothetical protein